LQIPDDGVDLGERKPHELQRSGLRL
jgi:hypothetical protein